MEGCAHLGGGGISLRGGVGPLGERRAQLGAWRGGLSLPPLRSAEGHSSSGKEIVVSFQLEDEEIPCP